MSFYGNMSLAWMSLAVQVIEQGVWASSEGVDWGLCCGEGVVSCLTCVSSRQPAWMKVDDPWRYWALYRDQ